MFLCSVLEFYILQLEILHLLVTILVEFAPQVVLVLQLPGLFLYFSNFKLVLVKHDIILGNLLAELSDRFGEFNNSIAHLSLVILE